jgi:hypothetical protein
MRGRTFSLAVIGLLAVGTTSASAVDITECGQVVPPRQVGNLVGDLDCTDPNSFDPNSYYLDAVAAERGATVNLNGFSLIGPESLPATTGVYCWRNCRVNGPGTITGFEVGIDGGRKKTKITDVDIVGAWDVGIDAPDVVVIRCTISGTRGSAGIRGRSYDYRGKIRIVDSVISDNETNGVTADKVIARNSEIVGNGFNCPGRACYDIWVKKRAILRNTTFGSCKAEPGGKCRAR